MAILKIAKLGHPVLLKKTNEISNLNDINLKQIIYDMSETMIDANGIGLAAPQVHLSHRLFIYRPGMSGLVRRSKKIKYSGIDLNGEKVFGEVEGLHARVLQHEFDHLNGILYTSRLADKRAFGYSEEIEKFWKKNDEEKSE